MRCPSWLRCCWLRLQLREERSRLAELLDHESAAQVDYVRAHGALLRANLALAVADLARDIARSRGRCCSLRRSISRLRSGLPEQTVSRVEAGTHGHV